MLKVSAPAIQLHDLLCCHVFFSDMHACRLASMVSFVKLITHCGCSINVHHTASLLYQTVMHVVQITVSFVHHVLLGAALGLAFGLATSFWLARIWLRPGECGEHQVHIQTSHNDTFECFYLIYTVSCICGISAASSAVRSTIQRSKNPLGTTPSPFSVQSSKLFAAHHSICCALGPCHAWHRQRI
jgi:hypothetical protein